MIALGIIIATVAAFVISAVFYATVPAVSAPSAPSRAPAALAVVELLRDAAVCGLVTGLLTAADWSGAFTGALLGLALCVLPVVLLVGSVFHEGVPAARAAIHAVDWAVKLVAIGAIVALFV